MNHQSTDLNDLPLSKVQEVIEHLQALVASPGWKFYIDTIEEQRRTRAGDVLIQPLGNLLLVGEQEFKKGEYAGLGIAAMLPASMIEQFKDYLKQHQPPTDEGAQS